MQSHKFNEISNVMHLLKIRNFFKTPQKIRDFFINRKVFNSTKSGSLPLKLRDLKRIY